MDDKTEQLRDIFMDVADEETVTESQHESHGSLATDEDSVDARLRAAIGRLREKFELRTALDGEQLCRLVRAFYAGDDDETIAAELGCTRREVFRTRMDLHLVCDEDLPGETLQSAIRAAGADESDEETTDRLAAEFEMEPAAVERAREAVAAVDRSRRVSQRFRTAFEETLTDADLSVQFTADAHEDGLEDATDGAEVDVEL
jgi:hypothetical protein